MGWRSCAHITNKHNILIKSLNELIIPLTYKSKIIIYGNSAKLHNTQTD
jgi:hypothetical protein